MKKVFLMAVMTVMASSAFANGQYGYIYVDKSGDGTPSAWVSLKGNDAKELYEKMQVAEQGLLQGATKKIGSDYECYKNVKAEGTEFSCSIYLRPVTGSIQTPN